MVSTDSTRDDLVRVITRALELAIYRRLAIDDMAQFVVEALTEWVEPSHDHPVVVLK